MTKYVIHGCCSGKGRREEQREGKDADFTELHFEGVVVDREGGFENEGGQEEHEHEVWVHRSPLFDHLNIGYFLDRAQT